MTTQAQLYRMVKSLAWRRRMTKRLEELESGIMDYMLEKNSSQMVVAGYLATLTGKEGKEGKELMLEKLPYVNPRQLNLNLQKQEGENYRGNSSSIEDVLGNDYKI